METSAYIAKYSLLYKLIRDSGEDLPDIPSKYVYIEHPSIAEMQSQIDLHMFWQIPLPGTLISMLVDCIKVGTFFIKNLDVYHHVDEQYWPLVKHFTGAHLDCRDAIDKDFTYSIELYKKRHTGLGIVANVPVPVVNIPTVLDDTVELSVVIYYHKRGIPWGNVMEAAVEARSIPHVKQFHEAGAPWANSLEIAIRMSDIECLVYMHSVGVLWKRSMEIAVTLDDIEIVQYLHRTGAHWYDSMKKAVEAGKLECLRYMHQYNVKHVRAMSCAARKGHIDCVRFLINEKYPMDDALEYLYTGGNIDLADYGEPAE